jgi:hypothetical protein
MVRRGSLRDSGGAVSVGTMSNVTARTYGYYYYYGLPNGSPGNVARG